MDVATLDTDLVDVEILGTLALLDGATELQVDEVGTRLVVGGGTNELDVIIWLEGCTEELGLAVKMLELGETVSVEEVIGAVDDTDVEGCTELLIDVPTLDTDLVDVKMLDILALLDTDAAVVVALEDIEVLELDEEYIGDEELTP